MAYFVRNNMPLEDDFNDAAIMVHAKDIQELMTALEEKEDRCVESLTNNKKFPGFYIRYMDTTTSWVDLGDDRTRYIQSSIGIDIDIICCQHTDGYKNRFLNLLKQTWARKYEADNIKKGRRLSYKFLLTNIFYKVFGTQGTMTKLFDSWIRQGSKAGDKSIIYTADGKKVVCKSKYLKDGIAVDVDDRQYTMLRNIDNYFDALGHGKKIGERRKHIIYDTRVPWTKFDSVLDAEHIKIKHEKKRRRKFLLWRKKNYAPILIKRRYYYTAIFCSEDRMKFAKNYDEQKVLEVKNLFKNNRYIELRELIEDYIDKYIYYGRRKIGFCFNSEILEILIKLLIIEAANTSGTPKSYKKKCSDYMKTFKTVPYQHFDDIIKVFNEQRTDSEELMKTKQEMNMRLNEFAQQQNPFDKS